MPSGIEVLQGRVARSWRHQTALAVQHGELLHVDALRFGDLLHLMTQSITDGLHVRTVPVAAHADTEDGLWQVVAYIEPELVPDLLADAVRVPCMQAGPSENVLHRADPCTLVRSIGLPIDDPDGRFRVEAAAPARLAGRRHLDHRVDHVLRADGRGDDVLAVDTVHEAHDRRVFVDDRPDLGQCLLQGTILEGDDQQIDTVCLGRRQDLRMVDLPVDETAVVL